MTQYPAAICYLTFLLLGLASPFLPLRFIGTTAALAALSWSGGRLLDGPMHWSDQNFGYTMVISVVQIFVGVVAAAISFRFAIAFMTNRLNRPMSPKHEAQVRTYRRLVVVAFGVVAGLALALLLAELLAGTSGGWPLDLGIAMLAAGSAVVAMRYLSRSKAAPVAALCLTLAAIAAIGSEQSSRIVRQAEAYANGRPWCLVGPSGTPMITSISQLGFFSLPKGRFYPHLALRLQTDEERDGAHWSIRKQRFERGWGTGVLPCHPRSDYGTVL